MINEAKTREHNSFVSSNVIERYRPSFVTRKVYCLALRCMYSTARCVNRSLKISQHLDLEGFVAWLVIL